MRLARAPLGRGWGWRVRDALGAGGPRAGVLVYHRVGDDHPDPLGQVVSASTLERHLRRLRKSWNVIATDDLTTMLADGRLEAGSIAVTFDDGYEDNLRLAAPIADGLGVPITVFVAVGFVLTGSRFWWDRLWETTAGGLGGTRLGLLLDGATEDPPASAAERMGRFRRLQALLDARDAEERDEIIADAFGGRPEADRPRPLTGAELRRLAAMPGVTVGAHTVTHPCLARVDAARERRELVEGRQALEAALARRIDLFAYPFGKTSDLSDRTRHAAGAAGYRAAFTTSQGPVTPTTHPLDVPRITMSECDESELVRRLVSVAGLGRQGGRPLSR